LAWRAPLCLLKLDSKGIRSIEILSAQRRIDRKRGIKKDGLGLQYVFSAIPKL
jgi:hypothetical protein